MLNCYSKKCFTGIIILMLLLAKTSYAAMRDTTVRQGNKSPDLVTGTVIDQYVRGIKDVKVFIKAIKLLLQQTKMAILT
jgi:hypothetical protein